MVLGVSWHSWLRHSIIQLCNKGYTRGAKIKVWLIIIRGFKEVMIEECGDIKDDDIISDRQRCNTLTYKFTPIRGNTNYTQNEMKGIDNGVELTQYTLRV
jgi:hypothetical protein